MYRLAQVEDWWPMAKKYPKLSNRPNVLKPVGYSYLINLIEKYNIKTILEVGHGSGSLLFEILKENPKYSLWGLDAYHHSVGKKRLDKFRGSFPSIKFIEGYLGDEISELPDNYFDLVCSVSVIEHIPHKSLAPFFKEMNRVLKPDGFSAHSYDVYWSQGTKLIFKSQERADFQWLHPEQINVFWEEWTNCPAQIDHKNDLFKHLIVENVQIVQEHYMWKVPRENRNTAINYFTILMASQKQITNKSE